MEEDEDTNRSGGGLAWLRRNRVSSAIIFVLLVALVTGSLGLWESPVKVRGKSLPPAASVERFTRGQTSFNAQLIWDSLSDDFTEELKSQGQEVSALQSQLDGLKQNGVKYTGVVYVGGHRAPTGESYYLYIFSRQDSGGPSSLESVPYVFVVNRSGKIERIE